MSYQTDFCFLFCSCVVPGVVPGHPPDKTPPTLKTTDTEDTDIDTFTPFALLFFHPDCASTPPPRAHTFSSAWIQHASCQPIRHFGWQTHHRCCVPRLRKFHSHAGGTGPCDRDRSWNHQLLRCRHGGAPNYVCDTIRSRLSTRYDLSWSCWGRETRLDQAKASGNCANHKH